MTDAERRMWRILRQCFPDARFRNQAPIGGYIADFCSHRARLIIEVDGGQHGGKGDAERSAWLEAEGFRLLRFWNHDVLTNAAGVAALIADALHRVHPHPTLPPPGGGSDGATLCGSLLSRTEQRDGTSQLR